MEAVQQALSPAYQATRTAGRGGTIAARQIFVTVRTAARVLTQEAIDTLAAVMRNGRAPPTARISAAVALLDRGHGRPSQAVDLNIGCDLARLTDAELETLERILERAALPSPNRNRRR